MSDCPQAVAACCNPVFQVAAPTTAPVTYWNTEQTAVAYCPAGYTGSASSVTKAANLYSSQSSQEDADGQAYQAALAEATAALSCTPAVVTYWNVERFAQCDSGLHDTPATWPATGDPVTVPAHSFSSTVSQATADALALAAAQASLVCGSGDPGDGGGGGGGIAGQLSGLVWQIPCVLHSGTLYGACTCGYASYQRQIQQVDLTGDPGTLYNITVRIRGVIEYKGYQGPYTIVTLGSVAQPGPADITAKTTAWCASQPDPNPWHTVFPPYPPFTTSGAVIIGGTDLDAAFNMYSLSVSDPPITYRLNNTTLSPAARAQVQVWPTDYTFTFQARAGATVTLTADSVNSSEVQNGLFDITGYVSGGIAIADETGLSPNAPTGVYDGQWLSMDVLSVTPV